ncbi:MAG TPA: glycosyltransferase [Holophagaceae bacterium]|nr:glycosyltransferase [Holophagaceae bacterium]
MIPRILHIIWVGDESKRPNRFIQTWKDQNPTWEVRIWGNAELNGRKWINAKHMAAMSKFEWNGVADMMRWEILHEQGGVLVDADSACIRPLPDWMLECEAFACWENEHLRPGLIAAGYFGTVPGTPFVAALIERIRKQPSVVNRRAWESVGPLLLTEAWRELKYANLTVLPSHFFIPRHFAGLEYTGGGPVFALQAWGSTLGAYDILADPKGTPATPTPAPPAGPAAPQAFLCEPDWKKTEWIEVLLAYLDAFQPEDPVALALLMDPAKPGNPPLEEAERSLLELVVKTGREAFPTVMIFDQPDDVLEHLRPYPQLSWIPKGRGNIEGLRGTYGARLARSRVKLARPENA